MVEKFGKIVIEDMTMRDLPLILNPLPPTKSQALVMWIVGFLIQLQAKHYIPYTALNQLLKFFYTSDMVAHFPATVHQMKKAFPIAHQFTLFVVRK